MHFENGRPAGKTGNPQSANPDIEALAERIGEKIAAELKSHFNSLPAGPGLAGAAEPLTEESLAALAELMAERKTSAEGSFKGGSAPVSIQSDKSDTTLEILKKL